MLDELSQYGTKLPQMLSIWESENIFNHMFEQLFKYDHEDLEGFKKLFPSDEIILEPENTEPF